MERRAQFGRDAGAFDAPQLRPGETGRVVIVGDDRTTVSLLGALARRFGYAVREFDDATAGLHAIPEIRTDVLVSAMAMRSTRTDDFLREVRRADADLEIVLIAGSGDERSEPSFSDLQAGVRLERPVNPGAFVRALRESLTRRRASDKPYRSVAPAGDNTSEPELGVLEGLMQTIEARSPYFRGHSQAVGLLAAAVALELGLPESEVEVVRRAGVLHDIGMAGVSNTIIERPGTLTEPEMASLRRHCELGAWILSPNERFASEALYILDHHERWDGSGYPGGKIGDDISLGGQIVGVAEAWTGITTDRAYRSARTAAEGYELIMRYRDEWFCGDVVEALVAADIAVGT